MFDSISDVTFRRQRAAINALGMLLSRKSAESTDRASPDEASLHAVL